MTRPLSPTERLTQVLAQRIEMKLAMRLRKTDPHDLLAWGKRYFPDYFENAFSDQHRWMATQFQSMSLERGQHVAIGGPRGSAKSSISTFLLPIYSICENLEKYIIFIADSIPQAHKYLEAIKDELVSNERLRKYYPFICGEGPTWNTGSIVTRNDIMVEALGVGSKIRGRRHGPHRPSLIIGDDMEGDDSAFSALKRNRCWDRTTKGILKAGNRKTNVMMVGSVTHMECTLKKLSAMPGWKYMEFRSILQWPDNMQYWEEWEGILFDLADPNRVAKARKFYEKNKRSMDKGAKVLWQDRFPLYDLMMTRAREGHVAFESEHQCNPIDPSKVEWGPEHFEYGDDMWFEEWPSNPVVKTMFLDPSKGKEDKQGDYQAIIKLAIANGFLWVDADIRRQPIKEMVYSTLSHAIGFKPTACGVEVNGFQECIAQELDQLAAAEQALVPTEPVQNYGVRKQARIRRLSPYVTRRKIKYKRKSPGVLLLLDQMRQFPNGEFDDGPDALEGAHRLAIAHMDDNSARNFAGKGMF